MTEFLVALLGGYLLGSLPTGLIVVRLVAGTDIRKAGSGNIGTVNVYRVAGLGPSILVLAVDVLKGAIPVLLARAWGYTEAVQVAAGLATIVGHNWSLFLRFGGGKGRHRLGRGRGDHPVRVLGFAPGHRHGPADHGVAQGTDPPSRIWTRDPDLCRIPPSGEYRALVRRNRTQGHRPTPGTMTVRSSLWA
jgi:hypothetical protein